MFLYYKLNQDLQLLSLSRWLPGCSTGRGTVTVGEGEVYEPEEWALKPLNSRLQEPPFPPVSWQHSVPSEGREDKELWLMSFWLWEVLPEKWWGSPGTVLMTLTNFPRIVIWMEASWCSPEQWSKQVHKGTNYCPCFLWWQHLAWVVLCVLYGQDKGVGIGWSGGTVCNHVKLPIL